MNTEIVRDERMQEEIGTMKLGLKRKLKNSMAWMFAVVFAGAAATVGAEGTAISAAAPIAKLDQAAGKVEYSKGGEAWRPVTRSKYLFAGYQIRTGADGSAKVLNQGTGATQTLEANSLIKVTDSGVQVVRGKLSGSGEPAGGTFWSALVNKFTKAQRYTTVRRDPTVLCKVETINSLSVSAQYPEVVWTNAGPDCSYRVKVADKVVDLPVSSTGEMIRYRLSDMSAGDHPFIVQVMQNGQVVYVQDKPSTLHWLGGDESAKFPAEEQKIRALGDDIQLASFFEDKGFMVPAMDAYRSYIAQNPDENDLRPLLIKTYNDLHLTDLRKKEALSYSAANSAAAGTGKARK